MGKWLKKRWKGLATVAGSFLAGLGSGEAIDLPSFLAALAAVIF